MNVGERLMVAADFEPDPERKDNIPEIRAKVMDLASALKGTGVIMKINSILRAIGYGLIEDLHKLGFGVCADLKLKDILATMRIDALMLREYRPELLTVMCDSGVDGMAAVAEVLSGVTEVLGVTVLTSFDEEESQEIYTRSSKGGVLHLARLAQLAGLDGLILSPQENEVIRRHKEIKLSLNNPGIRPKWGLVAGDDQKRVMTPADAIKGGAKRIVVGRPFTQAKDPREAVTRTLAEIEAALAA